MIDANRLSYFDPIFSFVGSEVFKVREKLGKIYEVFVRLYFSSKKFSPPPDANTNKAEI